ncbi:lipocalin family protein [candidate division KSB1 bacterium]|nr:lipocalin family protein [candidate division KSB1 bacterium]
MNCLVAVAFGNEPEIVNHVDLNRYAGLWYEIAKIPNSFQKKCAFGTTAEYSLQDNGLVRVVNRCFKPDGRPVEAKGMARIVDPDTNARLKVSFVRFLGKNWFWGDYWIIGLDADYQWAVVGHPDRKYGWILSRKPEITGELRREIDNLLTRQGYNPADFENTAVQK